MKRHNPVTDAVSQQISHFAGSEFAIEVWQRRKWLALVMVTIALAAVVAVALSLPNLYRATATVLVERQQVSEAFVRPSVTAELETRIQTIHQQVMSRGRLTEVINRLNLYPELRGSVPIDAIVEMMRRDIQLALKGVEQASGGRNATIAFTLSYLGRDPETVAKVANMLVDSYVEQNTESRERQAARTAEFLKVQLAESKRELDEEEQRSSEFKLRHTGELPQQLEVNLAALERLNTQLRLNGEYQIRAIERRERLEQRLADADAARSGPSQSSTPATKLLQLERELVDLRRQFSDRHPNVIRALTEIDSLRRTLAESATSLSTMEPAPAVPSDATVDLTRQGLSQVDKEIGLLKNEEAFLRQMIAAYETRIENAPKREEELQRLSRDYNSGRERYEILLKRYEEAQLAESLEQGQNVEQFRMLDRALPPRLPAAPNRVWLLLMGLVGSLALGFGTIVAAERLDTTFHTADDLRTFSNVPVVAAIRWIPTTKDARRHGVRFALTTLAVLAGLGLVAAGSYYVASGNEQITRMTVRGGG